MHFRTGAFYSPRSRPGWRGPIRPRVDTSVAQRTPPSLPSSTPPGLLMAHPAGDPEPQLRSSIRMARYFRAGPDENPRWPTTREGARPLRDPGSLGNRFGGIGSGQRPEKRSLPLRAPGITGNLVTGWRSIAIPRTPQTGALPTQRRTVVVTRAPRAKQAASEPEEAPGWSGRRRQLLCL